MTGTCEQCGAEFSSRKGQRFCSVACRNLAHRTILAKQCPACGVTFRPDRSWRVYCSAACAPGSLPGTTVEVTCEQCDSGFEVKPHESAIRRFCSRACKIAASRHAPRSLTCPICGRLFETTVNRQLTCSRSCGQAYSRPAAQRPWRVGARRLIARTCESCDALLPADLFSTSGDGTRLRRCMACVNASMTENQRARRRERGAGVRERAQSSTYPAPRWGQQWTGPELEIALREDLTAREAGLMLGRTYFAVQAARHRARVEPKWARVVGLGA